MIDNKTFNLCFILTLIIGLFVACVPFMYQIFGLEFLNFSQWMVVIIASILIIPLCELVKAILLKTEKNNKKLKKTLKNV